MARKRLTPANPDFLQEQQSAPQISNLGSPDARRSAMPPIAQVAADASASHALQELAQDMEALRAEGLVLLKLSLADIARDHLARDRARLEPETFAELVNSIQAHGQRMPIEVTELPEPTSEGARYGLISGWRRLSALEHLHKEGGGEDGGEAFATVTALLRHPKDSEEAYVAMVEENEIRVGLSYYERAGIALEAVRRGVFDTEKAALNALFNSASRAKRSRIRAFGDLHKELGDVLRFPTAIPERFGLQLIYAMRGTDGLAAHLRKELPKVQVVDGETEMDALARLIRGFQAKSAPPEAVPEAVPRAEQMKETLPNGVTVKMGAKKAEISGIEMTPELFAKLCAFAKDL